MAHSTSNWPSGLQRAVVISIAIVVGSILVGCSRAGDPASTSTSARSDAEVNRIRFECLKEKGWAVEYDEGAIVVDLPDEQRPRYRQDAEECLRVAGVDADEPLSEAQYKQIYASYTDIQKCLERGGWSTPTRPTLEAFIATYDSEPWIPWSDVPGPSLPQAGESCPAMWGGAG